MSEQSSSRSRETFHPTQNQQEQAFHQSSQQLRIEFPGQQNDLSLIEVLSQRIPVMQLSREVIDAVLINGVRELLLPLSSSIQQSYLQQILRQAQQQQVQASQQRHPEETNQFFLQLPIQTSQQLQQPATMSPESHTEQLPLQLPLQQMLHLINLGNTNTQMLSQSPQLLANSNLSSQDSVVASQQPHMQGIESVLSQASRQSPQIIQQENPQNNHFCVELHQQANLQQQQESLDVSQQQRVPETQQLLLHIPQQVPVFSFLQQPIQQPLLVQVLQQSSQQSCSNENGHSLLQVPQQPVQPVQQPVMRSIQQMPMQSSLQQMLLTQQAPLLSSQRSQMPPIQQQSIQTVQQPNQARPSILLEISRAMQQMQSNQPSTSSEQPVSQRIQQMIRVSQQSTPESRKMDSGIASSLLAHLAQMHQQQSNQQMLQQQQLQAVQEPSLGQFISWESMGIPVGILQVSESELQPSQQSSQTARRSLEIPQISLFDLPPQQFMRVIQQCPYNRPSSQESSAQESPIQSYQPSSLQSRQESSTPIHQQSSVLLRQELSAQLARELLLQSGQGSSIQSCQESSTPLHHESCTQLSAQLARGLLLQSGQKSSMQSCQESSTPLHHESCTQLSAQLARELLLQSGQELTGQSRQEPSISSRHESFTQLAQLPLTNQIKALPPEIVASTSRVNTSPVLNESVTIFNTDELQRTSTDGLFTFILYHFK
ncbi:hypothetical protein X798_06734 [Onchocerca flexuosa]|uniref:Uncharacterized protein n=1 Tax=Onchocerca flexuosa TaxID=387005 RepID=A0A238BLK3_9BILA|nr:hypothetical protein X798_06734 [Onchocerca flexuosa]